MPRQAVQFHHLHTITEVVQSWLLWQLDNTDFITTVVGEDHNQSSIQELLDEFRDIFTPLAGLPPVRNADHHIPLVRGTTPISMRPYCYNHVQKDEIEKLVAEMMAAGLIQPSVSPYSSPALLIKKKDNS